MADTEGIPEPRRPQEIPSAQERSVRAEAAARPLLHARSSTHQPKADGNASEHKGFENHPHPGRGDLPRVPRSRRAGGLARARWHDGARARLRRARGWQLPHVAHLHRPAALPPAGKTSDDTDTFEGSFLELVPNEKIVELIRFESPDPDFAGEMRMTTSLADAGHGTEVTVLCENIPPGISLKDNELGCRLALRNLAKLLEPPG
jgi:hypothetical protein